MDLIANFITTTKNGYQNQKKEVIVPSSKIILEIAKILKDKEKILDFKEKKISQKNFVRILLKYTGKTPILSEIKQISKPGQKVYSTWDKIPRILGGLGLVILSTSQGVMDGKSAKKKKIGGEVILKAW